MAAATLRGGVQSALEAFQERSLEGDDDEASGGGAGLGAGAGEGEGAGMGSALQRSKRRKEAALQVRLGQKRILHAALALLGNDPAAAAEESGNAGQSNLHAEAAVAHGLKHS